jgi:hypothetical protein
MGMPRSDVGGGRQGAAGRAERPEGRCERSGDSQEPPAGGDSCVPSRRVAHGDVQAATRVSRPRRRRPGGSRGQETVSALAGPTPPTPSAWTVGSWWDVTTSASHPIDVGVDVVLRHVGWKEVSDLVAEVNRVSTATRCRRRFRTGVAIGSDARRPTRSTCRRRCRRDRLACGTAAPTASASGPAWLAAPSPDQGGPHPPPEQAAS